MTAALALPAAVDPRTVDLRFSCLKEMDRSPLHYWQACQDAREETLAMRLGSGAHAILFGRPWVLWDRPAKKGSGKAPRNGEAWDEFQKEHEGKIILNATELAEADAMAGAVRACPLAFRLIEGAICEQTIRWTLNGRACRSTPDARSRLHVVELKTAQSAEPAKFQRDAFFRRYHAQLAFYVDAIGAAGEGEPQEAYVVAVESSPPYAVSVMRLTDRALDHGRWLYQGWLDRVLDCERANVWPAYSEAVLAWDVEA